MAARVWFTTTNCEGLSQTAASLARVAPEDSGFRAHPSPRRISP